MNYKKANIISLILTFLGVAIALPFLLSGNSNSASKVTGIIIILAGAIPGSIISIAFCRCPYCRRHLYIRYFILPKQCQHCGAQLKPERNDYI